MELYVLDDQLRRIAIIDMYESLIWSERFQDAGDFQMTIYSTNQTRSILQTGVQLALDKSDRIMVVETVEKKMDDDGKAILNVSGPSLESILKSRVAKDTMSNLTTDPTWDITNTPMAIAKQMFKEICILGQLSVDDKIPYIVDGDLSIATGSWYSLDPALKWPAAVGVWETAYLGSEAVTSPDSGDVISVSLSPQSLFQAIQDICQAYELGFRLIRNGDKSQLYFEVYTGVDHTTVQSEIPPVQFSYDQDNLSDSSELHSLTGSFNVAIVFSKNGVRTVVAPNLLTGVSGFDRRVMYVDASDIETAAGGTLNAQLDQRGYEALAANKIFSAFDGEVSRFGPYKYGRDFSLGDLIELQNSDGVVSKMRVTEQIFVHDTSGEREYPTLANYIVIEPHSWYGQSPTLNWVEVDSGLHWIDA